MVIARVSRAKVLEVDRLETTERGEGGFGHSGVK
jgi:dUTPase